MLASLTNARFAVPENPVMRGQGLGRLGYAMGQPVILSDDPFSNPGDMSVAQGAPGQNGTYGVDGAANGASGSQYSVGPNGQLQYNQIGPPTGDGYTASFCNAAINGGNASSIDLFQCSLRGYVGANGIYPPGTYVPPANIPPALIPDPPTSVTIPAAVMTVAQAPPVLFPPRRCAGQMGVQEMGIGMDSCWLAVGAGILAYLLIGGNRG